MADEHYSSVILQLEFENYHNAASCVDTSPLASTMTRTAAGIYISTDQKYSGGSSAYTGSGAGGYFQTVSIGSATDLTSTGDFTIECFFRPTSSINFQIHKLYGVSYGTYSVTINGTNIVFNIGASGGGSIAQAITSDTCTFTTGAWHHIAVTQSSTNQIKFWHNGAAKGTFTRTATIYGTTNILRVGAGTANLIYIDDVRITKGVCRYTSPFTPAAINAKAVAGKVLDDTGAACARTVRAYDRNTGYLIGQTTSNAGTGLYTLGCPPVAEVDVIVLDDTSGTTYNDLIQRVIPT